MALRGHSLPAFRHPRDGPRRLDSVSRRSSPCRLPTSIDQDPPYFHVKREGEWELKVNFAEGEAQMFRVGLGRRSQGESASEDREKRRGEPVAIARGVGGERKPVTVKPGKRHIVEFYATSARLAHAFRHFAKHNKTLGRLATIQQLGDIAATHDLGKRSHEFQRVVLSHADDDRLALDRAPCHPVRDPFTSSLPGRPPTPTRSPNG